MDDRCGNNDRNGRGNNIHYIKPCESFATASRFAAISGKKYKN
jgi:hypothetical protein